MPERLSLNVNGQTHVIEVDDPNMPLLYALRDDLGSRALFEEVRFDENMVTSVDWLTYPVLHIESVPASIEIHLIDRPEASPPGAAEMALGPVPCAIGDAVFDATGVRSRRVPFTPERVKKALAASLSDRA